MPTLFVYGDETAYPNYQQAVLSAGGQLRFSQEIKQADDCVGLLLPGGGDVSPLRYGQTICGSHPADFQRDAAELALIEQFVSGKKPILGICRGLQLLNVYFGGTLLQDIPGHDAAGEVDRLHTANAASSFLTTLYGDSSVVNSSHHQAVDCLGDGLTALQWAEDGVVEALCHKTLPIWAVQWHPERLCGSLARREAVDGHRIFHWFLQNL